MRFKFLLLILIFAPKLLSAQCDYPTGVDTTLIITEARFMTDNWVYLELTNVGTKPIFLSKFKIGKLADLSWSAGVVDLCNDPWWMPSRPGYIFLPEKVLMPGKSWVMTTGYDFGPEFYKEHQGRLGGSERPKNPEWYEVADKVIHLSEPINGVSYPGDSITTPYNDPEQTVKRGNYADLFSAVGGGTYFIEHHYSSTDSAVVDQVGGFFDGTGGLNIRGKDYDIAGVYDAPGTSVLVRKNTIKSGNLDFANSVGTNYNESDWMPIPMPSGYDQWRDLWWTIGNHGNYVLDENTLEPLSNVINVDFAGKKITLPWGIRRLDEIMRHMKYKPGVAWNYVLNGVQEDSLYRSAHTGDRLIIYVVGSTFQTDTFDIVVKEPTTDDNIVIPIDHRSSGITMTPRTQDGILDWPRVTKLESGMDTITGLGFGLEYDMRVDTLIKYLELPDKATWEIDWVDGVVRADLKNGDILKVTSESGKLKEYFIQLQSYLPSNNASLSAITWPDIPDWYRGILGWKGDTIPAFSSGTYNYQLEIPYDVDYMPALIPTKFDYNATIKTKRARSVSGQQETRTIEFEVTAEDDSTTLVYTVELIKEQRPENIEPIKLDPFYSEWVNQYTSNCWVEVYNPGPLPIDLRNYAFSMDKTQPNPYGIIDVNPTWERRYGFYIPGLKYVDSTTWYNGSEEFMIPDVNVNPILRAGDCFVMAKTGRDYPEYDMSFSNAVADGFPNPWNETVTSASSGGIPMPPNGNRDNSMFMFKVLNDSIKKGTKAIVDVNDFEVIDVWGMPGPDFGWIVGDHVAGDNEHNDIYKRKPWVHKGNPIPGGAFAPGDAEACEWIRIVPSVEYGDLPNTVEVALGGVGSHFMEPITYYKSTVYSLIYKVSPGYGLDEEILGIVAGTTISEFSNNIFKEDEKQTFTFTGADKTTVLADNAVLSMDDMLIVLSADSTMTTYYRLDVTAEGLVLSSDAVLKSNKWSIDIAVSPNPELDVVGEATITGFEYGTTLKAVMDDITAPAGASVTFINSEGGYVALNKLNYDTIYVAATVGPEILIDVLAEDGQTEIVYNLVPNSTESDAFIMSDVYLVSQNTKLIEYVPLGVTFNEFLSNIIIPNGATLKLIDKVGLERTSGEIKADDKVVVTSANGEVSEVYYISLLFPGHSSATYLAFVISEIYSVNQVDYLISGTAGSPLTEETTVASFMQGLVPSVGATLSLLDAGANVKTSGNLAEGDVVRVTSGDNVLVTYYSVILGITSSRMPLLSDIAIYPNPAYEELNISGLDRGNRVQIYSIQGKLIKEVQTYNNHVTIRLENVPEGLFLIIIRDENQILGQFKAVKN